jgi:hypothetical protein
MWLNLKKMEHALVMLRERYVPRHVRKRCSVALKSDLALT